MAEFTSKGNSRGHKWEGNKTQVVAVSCTLNLDALACKYVILQFKSISKGFPGGAVVGSLPASAGDAGSSPGLGGSHMPRSSWAHEPQLLSPRVWSLCSAAGEAAIVGGPRTAVKGGPHLPQLEKALAQKRRPNITINQSINKSLKKINKKKNNKSISKVINLKVKEIELAI